MPSYTLTQDEERVITSWLFEPVGYLDTKSLSLGQTARQALALDSGLDITQWVRDNGSLGWDFNGRRLDFVGNELAMIWWTRVNNRVNIPTSSRPAETTSWISVLEKWNNSIIIGLTMSSVATRNTGTPIVIYDEAGAELTPALAGDQAIDQQQIITKVLGVLQ